MCEFQEVCEMVKQIDFLIINCGDDEGDVGRRHHQNTIIARLLLKIIFSKKDNDRCKQITKSRLLLNW